MDEPDRPRALATLKERVRIGSQRLPAETALGQFFAFLVGHLLVALAHEALYFFELAELVIFRLIALFNRHRRCTTYLLNRELDPPYLQDISLENLIVLIESELGPNAYQFVVVLFEAAHHKVHMFV